MAKAARRMITNLVPAVISGLGLGWVAWMVLSRWLTGRCNHQEYIGTVHSARPGDINAPAAAFYSGYWVQCRCGQRVPYNWMQMRPLYPFEIEAARRK